eukprot:1187336-Prorocentrum_minimum.AAC.8
MMRYLYLADRRGIDRSIIRACEVAAAWARGSAGARLRGRARDRGGGFMCGGVCLPPAPARRGRRRRAPPHGPRAPPPPPPRGRRPGPRRAPPPCSPPGSAPPTRTCAARCTPPRVPPINKPGPTSEPPASR